jgi:beta-glucanase (GH16 family)
VRQLRSWFRVRSDAGRHGRAVSRRQVRLIRSLCLTVAIGGSLVLVVAITALVRISGQPTHTTASSAKARPSATPETGVPSPGGKGFQLSTGSPSPTASASASPSSSPSSSEASATGGPPTSVPGWTLTYSTDFPGNSLPPGWGPYQGQPGGDPYGLWNPANVTVSGNELHLLASPNGQGGYSTGAVSFGGNPQTYGMYLVRMKGDYEPGLAISDIALLWPASNAWPPEIDFFEDGGDTRGSYAATVHLGPTGDNSNRVQEGTYSDATQWHTYGVIWTATSITFTRDGQPIGNAIYSSGQPAWPNIPMNLDLDSQNLGPTQPSQPIETLTVAWVAEYTMN